MVDRTRKVPRKRGGNNITMKTMKRKQSPTSVALLASPDYADYTDDIDGAEFTEISQGVPEVLDIIFTY